MPAEYTCVITQNKNLTQTAFYQMLNMVEYIYRAPAAWYIQGIHRIKAFNPLLYKYGFLFNPFIASNSYDCFRNTLRMNPYLS